MTPGHLHRLLEGCRADSPTAWEEFTHWVKKRGHAILGTYRLSEADREDAIGSALNRLIPVVRSGRIRGCSNSEIDRYVCRVILNQAHNFLRTRGRVHGIGGVSDETTVDGEAPESDVADDRPLQDRLAIVAEQLRRGWKLLESWHFVDRYLFLAKIGGVPARKIQQMLRHFDEDIALATVDTRFHRLRADMIRYIEEP